MLIKTNELVGNSLDWAVAKCEGFSQHAAASVVIMGSYSPSTNWAKGGPIIEREKIELLSFPKANVWIAQTINPIEEGEGETALVAAMRCYVAIKLGNIVEVPDGIA